MPATTYLHIQSREAMPTRVMELRGTSVRIGRGVQCEVQLGEPALAEVQCLLRRRGETWHVQPVGPNGRISIDGRPVDQQRPLPLGMALRVGDHWLSLRPAEAAAVDDRETVTAAMVWEAPEASGSGDLSTAPATTSSEGIRSAAEGLDAERERLARWQSQLQQRERWLKERQQESRWEARWRAAGENLRTPAAASPSRMPAATTAPPPPPPPSRSVEPIARARPVPPPAAKVAVPSRLVPLAPRRGDSPPTPSPIYPLPSATALRNAPPSRRLSPIEPDEPLAIEVPEVGASQDRAIPIPEDRVSGELLPERVGTECLPLPPGEGRGEGSTDEALTLTLSRGERGPELPLPPGEGRGEGGPTGVAGNALTLTLSRGERGPELPLLAGEERLRSDRSLVDPAAARIPDPGEPSSPSASLPSASSDSLPVRRRGRRFGRFLGRLKRVAEPPTANPDQALVEEAGPVAGIPKSLEDDPLGLVEETRVVAADDGPTRSLTDVDGSEVAEVPIPASFETIPDGSETAAPAAMLPPEGEPPGARTRHETDPEWPSARSILEAARRPQPPGTVAPRGAAVRSASRPLPMPTVSCEPAHWTVPFFGWLWTPAVALVLVVGLGGLRLCWLWAQDDRAAGRLADRLLRPGPPPEDRDDAEGAEEDGPAPSWWTSTAGHILLRARGVQGSGTDADRAAQVEFLLQAARNAAPAQSSVRFALARLSRGHGGGLPAGPVSGLSRDVVALAWAGHLWLEAGRTAEALAAYRAALEMAGRADLARLDPPAFQEDLQVRRYALPGEDLIGPVVRDLADHGDLTFETWSQALPAFAVAPLVAARVLRERGSADADRALERAVAAAEGPPPSGTSPAVHRAAGAEALALLGRSEEAEVRYRQAVAHMPDDRIRRSWWVNLADLYARLGDAERTQAAREAAKGPDPGEEITRRVIDAQLHDGIGASGPTPAADALPPSPIPHPEPR